MKKYTIITPIIIGCFVGFCILIKVFSTESKAVVKPIKLSTGDWEPYTGEKLEDNGPVCQLIRETFSRMGYKPKFSFSSWGLASDKIRRKEVVAGFPYIKTEKRKKDFSFSEPIFDYHLVTFYKKSRINILIDTLIDTLIDGINKKKYTFGKISGYEYPSQLKNVSWSDSTYKNSLEAFKALAEEDIDFLPEGRIHGLYLSKHREISAHPSEFGILDSKTHPIFSSSQNLYLLFPKSENGRKLKNEFNKNFKYIKDSTLLYENVKQDIEKDFAYTYYDLVELIPITNDSYIEVKSKNNAQKKYYVPKGSKAFVRKWPPFFTKKRDTSLGKLTNQFCTVKLINGPLKGEEVDVDIRSVVLVSSFQ